MGKDLEFTGERFIPGTAGEIWHEHWHRYHFAAPLVAGLDVLDVACGEGYGSALLASRAAKVIGADIAASAVEHAREQYARVTNLEFRQADCAALPFADASFDTVLLLEVLEHVADARGVLAEISRVLKPGAVLLISVPFLYPIHDAPHDYLRFTPSGIDAELSANGFEPASRDLRSPGFAAAGFLASVACAEAALAAWREKSWRIVLAPFALLAVPLINALGWIATRLFATSQLIATGYAIRALKR